MNSEKQSTNLQMTLREVNRVGEGQKNVPKLRFKGYEDAWEQRKLGKILKERTERAKGDEELLSVTINKGVIRQLESDKRNTSSENKSNYKLVYKGDIPYNSMRMWQGAVGVSQFEGIVSPAYTVLIPSAEVDGKFLMELFKKNSSQQIFTRWSQGLTSDTWNLKYPTLSKVSFFIPYIKEQNKLAKLLQELDNLITLHQRKYDALKTMKKTLLSKMFPKDGEDVPEIRFKGFTDAWEQRKLGEISKRVQGNDGRMNLPTLTISAAYGWMDQVDRFSGNIAGTEQKNYTLLKKGELSYNHGNSKLAKYGAVFELSTYEEALVPKVYHSFKMIKGDSRFIEYLFATKLPDRELSKLISSGARMDGLLNITYSDFTTINLTVPSETEQKRVSNCLKELDDLITLHQRKLDELKNMKKTLLQQMFV